MGCAATSPSNQPSHTLAHHQIYDLFPTAAVWHCSHSSIECWRNIPVGRHHPTFVQPAVSNHVCNHHHPFPSGITIGRRGAPISLPRTNSGEKWKVTECRLPKNASSPVCWSSSRLANPATMERTRYTCTAALFRFVQALLITRA